MSWIIVIIRDPSFATTQLGVVLYERERPAEVQRYLSLFGVTTKKSACAYDNILNKYSARYLRPSFRCS